MGLPTNYGYARRNVYGGYNFYNSQMRFYGSSRSGLGNSRYNYYDRYNRFRGYDYGSNGRYYK